MKTACLLAFYGFLRCGEFTTRGSVFDSSVDLCIGDICFVSSSEFTVNIKASKTDPFRKGHILYIFRNNNVLCPYTAMQQFINLRLVKSRASIDPLFLMSNNKPLNRSTFLHNFQSICQALHFKVQPLTGHSFRIGAATAAAASQVPDHIIQLLGRWKSDCYKRYIRTPKLVFQQAQNALINV